MITARDDINDKVDGLEFGADENELMETLESLSENSNVLLFQPNYTYQSTGTITSDSLISKQWALYNDGTFYTVCLSGQCSTDCSTDCK